MGFSGGFIGSVIEVQCITEGRWFVYAIGDGSSYFEDFDSALQYVKELMEFRLKQSGNFADPDSVTPST